MNARHPYVGLPNRQFWKREFQGKLPSEFDPVSPPSFRLLSTHKVVTAGSCFAQHVARYISNSGYTHYIAETCHPLVPKDVAKAHNYGKFSARYGNIYTARQLLQLLQRAYGLFSPDIPTWEGKDSKRIVDPFRPQIQPGGFASSAELEADRRQHFKAIRDAVEKMDVFVFTLGLTECWADRGTGAVFPIAPGVAGGQWDPARTEFLNFDEQDSIDDLTAALSFIRQRNPKVEFILTVSPVPLNATMEDRHVFVSTTWSKAVLRITAERMTRQFERCTYFPSFEIITAPRIRGQYYEEDAREVTEQGVNHVMGLFFRHFTGVAEPHRDRAIDLSKNKESLVKDHHIEAMESKIEVLCDEESIDNQTD